jgi:muconolactone delta-isomerase
VKIIAIEKDMPGAKPEDFQPHLKAETQRVIELQQEDMIREIYFRQDKLGAVIILECANVEAAQDALNTLPLVKEGLITFDVIPLKPYPGFSRLFANEY